MQQQNLKVLFYLKSILEKKEEKKEENKDAASVGSARPGQNLNEEEDTKCKVILGKILNFFFYKNF